MGFDRLFGDSRTIRIIHRFLEWYELYVLARISIVHEKLLINLLLTIEESEISFSIFFYHAGDALNFR